MAVFAPGVWAGVNDAMAIERQRKKGALDAQERQVRIKRSEWETEQAREQQARDLRARQGLGAGLYRMYGGDQQPPGQGGPPGVGGPPPGMGGQPGAPMAPPPGQSSASPPGQQQGAGGPPPQGQPPGPQQGMPPQQQMGAGGPPPGPGGPPQGMPPPQQQDPALMRAVGDVQALNRELAQPGLNSEQKQIITAELGKAQERLAQMRGQQTPYRALPSGPGAGGQPGAGAQPPQGGPPPVAPAQPQQPSLLKRFVAAAQQNGVPPEDLAEQIKMLSPIMQAEMREELMALRGTQAEHNAYIKTLMLANAEKRENRLGDQGDRRLDQGDKRLQMARDKVQMSDRGEEKLTPGGLKVAQELVRAGQPLPGGWSKAGAARGNAILNAMAEEEEGGAGSGAIATGRAEAKASSTALTQLTKDLAAIRPYKEMLDKNANIAIELGKKASLSNSAWANKSVQWLQKNGASNPDLREYLAQINTVQTEAARVLSNPRLVGQLTDSARHEMQQVVDGTMPLADTERVLKRLMKDGDNRVDAMVKEQKSLTKGVSGKRDDKVDPKDQEAIDWAKAHKDDPRAKKILQMHGM